MSLLECWFRDSNCVPPGPALPCPVPQALLGDSGSQNWSTGTADKYGRLDRELQLANSHFIEEQQAQQQVPENPPAKDQEVGGRALPSGPLPAMGLRC